MVGPRRILVFAALVAAAALAGEACATREAAVRVQGSGSAGTSVPSTTRPGSMSPVSTTTVTRPIVTTVSTARDGGAVPASGVNGEVTFAPVCPVERIPPDPQCAPRPGAAALQLVRPDGSVAATGRAGTDGRYAMAVGPGRYVVKASTVAALPGGGCQAEPAEVTVVAGSLVSVAVRCDTGIR